MFNQVLRFVSVVFLTKMGLGGFFSMKNEIIETCVQGSG